MHAGENYSECQLGNISQMFKVLMLLSNESHTFPFTRKVFQGVKVMRVPSLLFYCNEISECKR